ncbi:MAG: HlyD family efflux transporter periplasmic adaptor subunit [Nannocystaceae bacterium]
MRSGAAMRSSTLEAAGSIDGARVLAHLLVVSLGLALLALFVTPWQQSVTGAGRLIAYTPEERQQAIEAPIEGRIRRWHVQEGDRVEAGDQIVEIADNDPEILDRLDREREAIKAQRDAAALSIAVGEAKITSLEGSRTAAILNVGLKVKMAEDRRDGAERALDAAAAAYETAKLNAARQRRLEGQGLASTRARELATLELETTSSQLDRARASLKAAAREIKALDAERKRVEADADAKIAEAKESVQKATSEQAKAEAALAKIDVRLAQQQTMDVRAPRAGTVLRVVARQGGEVVKQGDALAVIVPDAESRAVELWVDGNDAPLVTPGDHARLQFEGWPAVQFVGWPSVAVGTFGGTVAFVDAAGDDRGMFRVVVVPDEEWPHGRYLRQGVRANGWILLNQVTLGYELWRQFNGFPPALPGPGDAREASEGKG